MPWGWGTDHIEECENGVMETGSTTSAGPDVVLGLQRLSFAYQNLSEIPYDPILQQQDTLEVLDLSYNLLDDSFGGAGEAQHTHPGLQQL